MLTSYLQDTCMLLKVRAMEYIKHEATLRQVPVHELVHLVITEAPRHHQQQYNPGPCAEHHPGALWGIEAEQKGDTPDLAILPEGEQGPKCGSGKFCSLWTLVTCFL